MMQRICAIPLVFLLMVCSPVRRAEAQAADGKGPPTAGQGSVAPQPSPEVRYVAACILAARARLRSWTATVTYVKEQSLEGYRFFERKRAEEITGRPRITRTVETATWRCREPKLTVVVARSPELIPGLDVLTAENLVVNGKTATYLQTYVRAATSPDESGETRQNASISAVGSEIGGNLRAIFSHLDPRTIAFYTGTVPLDKEFASPTAGVKFVGNTLFDGAHCMTFEYRVGKEGTAVVGVDRDHGFVIRTMEVYVTIKGQKVLTSRTLTTKVAEGNGVWMPAVVEREMFVPRLYLSEYRNEKDPKKTVRILREEVTITDFKADVTLPDNTFDLDLPAGVEISDHTKVEKKPVGSAP